MQTTITKKIGTILLTTFIVTAVTVLHAHARGPVVMETVKGDVQMRADEEAEWEDAEEGAAVSEGSEIKTGRSGEAILKWDSGHSVKVSSLTKIVFDELLFTRATGMEKSVLNVSQGRLLSVTNKLINSGSVFEVKTPTARAGVRGTKFVVEVDGDESFFIVIEGQISVMSESIEIILDQNFQTTVGPGMAPSAPESIPSNTLKKLNREAKTVAGEEKASKASPKATASSDSDDVMTDDVYEDIADGIVEDRLQEQIIYETTSPSFGCCD